VRGVREPEAGRPVVHRTVAEELVDRLTLAGVERVYGIVGDSLNAVTDAIQRSRKLK
jgi:pyruvate dehydrogenase (quinone)